MEKLVTFVHKDEDGNEGMVPTFKTAEAACADVYLPKDIAILAHDTIKIDLLVSFLIPHGYAVFIYPRSSLLIKHNIIQPVSVIDSDYTGHVHVPLHSLNNTTKFFKKGERLAQIRLVKLETDESVDWERETTERDQNGFGGTGK